MSSDAEEIIQTELTALRILLEKEGRAVMLLAMMQDTDEGDLTPAVLARTNTNCTPRQALVFAGMLDDEAETIRRVVENGRG